eukprot:2909418-Amphidinium_carterae.1
MGQQCGTSALPPFDPFESFVAAARTDAVGSPSECRCRIDAHTDASARLTCPLLVSRGNADEHKL